MARYRFLWADVFTTERFGGNQLAIVPEAGGLDDTTMQNLARELNISETIYVFPSSGGPDHRLVRIFTPTVEMPFAGHPTIGAGVVLGAIGALDDIAVIDGQRTVVFDEGVGPVPVQVLAAGGRATCSMPTMAKPVESAVPSASTIAGVLGLEADALDPHAPPAIYAVGVPFLIVPVIGDALTRIAFDTAGWRRALAGTPAESVYVVALPAGDELAYSRMFAPSMGIVEDPATGSAAAAFSGYLAARFGAEGGTASVTIHQGVEMGRPSVIDLTFDHAHGLPTAISLGGNAVTLADGWVEV